MLCNCVNGYFNDKTIKQAQLCGFAIVQLLLYKGAIHVVTEIKYQLYNNSIAIETKHVTVKHTNHLHAGPL